MSASRCRWWGSIPRGCARSRCTPPWRHAATSLAAIVATAVVLLAAGAPAGRAAPLRDCTPSRGTIVAVDFAHWGGPIVRGCGVGQRTGYALLHAAGFTTAGDAHDGPGIVCRIGDAAFRDGTQYPTPSEQSCVQTPPTTAYWAYWVARAGSDRWSYSPLGAMGDVPKPGEVELWIFGATNVAGTRGTAVPRFSPATLRARAAAPMRPRTHTSTATTTTATRTRSTSTTSSTPTTTTPTTAAAHHASTPQRRARSVAHRAHRRTHHRIHHRLHRKHHGAAAITGGFTTSPTRTGTNKVVAARATNTRATTGSTTPLIIGGALVLLLCAGAGRAIWRHRSEE